MPKYRSVWRLSGPQGETWDEVYDDGDQGPAATPVTPASPVVVSRLKLLHSLCKIRDVTVRDTANPGGPPAEFPINLQGTAPANEGGPANTDEAAVIKLACQSNPPGTSSSRFIWIRGVPEGAVSRDATTGLDQMDAQWRGRMQQWFVDLRAANYGMWPRTRSLIGGGAPRFYIKTVVGNPGQDTTVLSFEGNVAHPVGTLIQINGNNPKQLPGMRGQFVVTASAGVVPPGTTSTITVRYRCAQDNPPASGYFYLLLRPTFAIVNPATCSFAYLGSRQTKKPLTGSRGRKSAVRLRLLG